MMGRWPGWSLPLALVATAMLGGASVAWACTPSAYIYVTPTSGEAGSQITVDGGEWVPGDGVQLRWDSPTGRLLGVGTGPNFSVAVTVPEGASSGTHLIVAQGASDGFNRASFHVVTQASGDDTQGETGSDGEAPDNTDQSANTDGGGQETGDAGEEDRQVASEGTTSRTTDGGSGPDDSGGEGSGDDRGITGSDPAAGSERSRGSTAADETTGSTGSESSDVSGADTTDGESAATGNTQPAGASREVASGTGESRDPGTDPGGSTVEPHPGTGWTQVDRGDGEREPDSSQAAPARPSSATISSPDTLARVDDTRRGLDGPPQRSASDNLWSGFATGSGSPSALAPSLGQGDRTLGDNTPSGLVAAVLLLTAGSVAMLGGGISVAARRRRVTRS